MAETIETVNLDTLLTQAKAIEEENPSYAAELRLIYRINHAIDEWYTTETKGKISVAQLYHCLAQSMATIYGTAVIQFDSEHRVAGARAFREHLNRVLDNNDELLLKGLTGSERNDDQ
jgi:hypothetical protein